MDSAGNQLCQPSLLWLLNVMQISFFHFRISFSHILYQYFFIIINVSNKLYIYIIIIIITLLHPLLLFLSLLLISLHYYYYHYCIIIIIIIIISIKSLLLLLSLHHYYHYFSALCSYNETKWRIKANPRDRCCWSSRDDAFLPHISACLCLFRKHKYDISSYSCIYSMYMLQRRGDACFAMYA